MLDVQLNRMAPSWSRIFSLAFSAIYLGALVLDFGLTSTVAYWLQRFSV